MATVTVDSGNTPLYTVKVTGLKPLSANVFEISLERPPAFQFQPGQRAIFHCLGLERDYSMVSAPSEDRLVFCIRRVEGGAVTPWLTGRRSGDVLDISGPYGRFTFRPTKRPVVFVATGVGVAPFVGMARAGAAGFTLLHGVPDPAELYYRQELEAKATLYVPCLSQPANSPLPESYFAGRVTAWLTDRLPAGEYDFYAGGRKDMIGEAALIVDERFPGSKFFSEVFY
jgi:ferredoxin-NADP reductase